MTISSPICHARIRLAHWSRVMEAASLIDCPDFSCCRINGRRYYLKSRIKQAHGQANDSAASIGWGPVGTGPAREENHFPLIAIPRPVRAGADSSLALEFAKVFRILWPVGNDGTEQSIEVQAKALPCHRRKASEPFVLFNKWPRRFPTDFAQPRIPQRQVAARPWRAKQIRFGLFGRAFQSYQVLVCKRRGRMCAAPSTVDRWRAAFSTSGAMLHGATR